MTRPPATSLFAAVGPWIVVGAALLTITAPANAWPSPAPSGAATSTRATGPTVAQAPPEPSATVGGGGPQTSRAAPASPAVPLGATPPPVRSSGPAAGIVGGSGPATDAGGTLERARAAYEYGDIDEMIVSARLVSEGQLHPTPTQRASALRYLGIGLFLTGSAEGAETAFFELLRLRPESRLDAQTTRPDVVAFFEQVRRRYAEPIRDAARASNRKVFAWNLLPPAGQLQNGAVARAITLGGIEVVSLTSAITTYVLLKRWQSPDDTFPGHQDTAQALRVINWTSVGVLAATFIFGVIDGIAHYSDRRDDTPTTGESSTARVTLTPAGLTARF